MENVSTVIMVLTTENATPSPKDRKCMTSTMVRNSHLIIDLKYSHFTFKHGALELAIDYGSNDDIRTESLLQQLSKHAATFTIISTGHHSGIKFKLIRQIHIYATLTWCFQKRIYLSKRSKRGAFSNCCVYIAWTLKEKGFWRKYNLLTLEGRMYSIYSNSRPCPYKRSPIIFWSYKP